jgi:hypothetical protein
MGSQEVHDLPAGIGIGVRVVAQFHAEDRAVGKARL